MTLLDLINSLEFATTEEKRKDFINWIIDVIDSKRIELYPFQDEEEKEKEEKKSMPLKKINLNFLMREIVVTPNYKIDVDSLKNFLLIDVIGIVSEYNGSVGWKYIQERINGKKKSHSYRFFPEELDKYFDLEANKKAFLEQSKLFHQCKTGNDKSLLDVVNTIEENMVFDVWIPFLLLRDIQTIVRQYLGQYYAYYMKNYEKTENGQDKKYNSKTYGDIYEDLKKIHQDCMKAILLQEIFLGAVPFDQQRVEAIPAVYFCLQEFRIGLYAEQFVLMLFESVFLKETLNLGKGIEHTTEFEWLEGLKWLENLEWFSNIFQPTKKRVKVEYPNARDCLQTIFKKIEIEKVYENEIDLETLFDTVEVYLDVIRDNKNLQEEEILSNLYVIEHYLAAWALASPIEKLPETKEELDVLKEKHSDYYKKYEKFLKLIVTINEFKMQKEYFILNE